MNNYWKLIHLDTYELTTHETKEEVYHIIEYLTRDINDKIIRQFHIGTEHPNYNFINDKIIRQFHIGTEHPNYNFECVEVSNCNDDIVATFVYFFDTIEEELDSRDDCPVREPIEYDNKGGWVKPDYIYSDTDSVKILNLDSRDELLNANRRIELLERQVEILKDILYKVNDLTHPF